LFRSRSKLQGVDSLVAMTIESLNLEFKTCPIKNGSVISVSNFTDKKEVAQFLSVPPGNYYSTVLLYNEFDDQMFENKVKFFIKATSTEKYEFK
jgi:hypothetical protein